MGYVIWGCGNRGTNIYKYFKDKVVAFIDSDTGKIGTEYMNLPVLSFAQFQDNYSEHILIVSPWNDADILEQLVKAGIREYFNAKDCPKETVDEYNPEIAQKIIENLSSGKCSIVGFNLWSLYLGIALRDLGRDVELINDTDLSDNFANVVSKIENIRIGKMTDINANNNVLVASGKYSEPVIDNIISQNWKDVFYLGKFLPEHYHNKEIEKFKDCHKGEECFIVATGPSVRIEDLNILKEKQKICFSMNKIFYAFDQTEWRPDYYVVEDGKMLEFYRDDVSNIKCAKFLADTYGEDINYGDCSYRFHLAYPKTNNRPGYADEISYGMVSAYSVVFECIYFAIYMGFKKIYLLGADLNYSSNLSDPSNHFYGDKDAISRKDSSVNQPFFVDTVIRSYAYAKKFAEHRDVEIFNATRGGKLEIFERVDFDYLMGLER